MPNLASRMTGSSDLFGHRGRRPWASINFVTAHDGFTLADLVSYNDKHNEANLEDNRDGINENDSWNCGVEGATDDPGVLELRERQRRNIMATLLLSQGVPMLLAGDEIGNGQGGNNNVYCQDNEISWIDWTQPDTSFLRFVQRLSALRLRHPVFHRGRFFRGRVAEGEGRPDIVWLAPAGRENADEDWNYGEARTLGMLLTGDTGDYYFTTPAGVRELDRAFLILLNAHHEEVPFVLPPEGGDWEAVIDTAAENGGAGGVTKAGEAFPLQGRSLVVLVRREDGRPFKLA